MNDAGTAAAAAVDTTSGVVDQAARSLAKRSVVDGRISVEALDRHQIVAYDLAHATPARSRGCRVMLECAQHGELEASLACAHIAGAISDVGGAVDGAARSGASSRGELSPARLRRRISGPELPPGRRRRRSPERHRARAPPGGFDLVRDSFHRLAADQGSARSPSIHRDNLDIPEDVISGLADSADSASSEPEAYGGLTAGPDDYLGMVVATEELSRGSLGIGGSLITRPEILTRALVRGGTEAEARLALPHRHGRADGRGHGHRTGLGSDFASLQVSATPTDGGYRVNGTKTWATFAGRAGPFMVLAGTDPDTAGTPRPIGLRHREAPGTRSSLHQRWPRRHDGGPGHRHDRLPGHALLRGVVLRLVRAGREPRRSRRGARSRLLPADGRVRERPPANRGARGRPDAGGIRRCGGLHPRPTRLRPTRGRLPALKAKLARMAALIQAGRQFCYEVARRMGCGEGALEATGSKPASARPEWVTREAMQLHGGMGYAEEFAVSRYFVDARVLSIFEGADETLCLRVIARRLTSRRSQASPRVLQCESARSVRAVARFAICLRRAART